MVVGGSGATANVVHAGPEVGLSPLSFEAPPIFII
jgi:hypothetical protein